MVAALVQSKAGTAATSGKVATVQPDSNVTAGNLLVLVVVRGTSTAEVDLPVAAISDNQGGAWKQCEEVCELGIQFDAGTHQHATDIWYCERAVGGVRPVITALLNGFPPIDPSLPVLGRMVLFLLEYSGFTGYEPFQTGGVKWTTGTTVSPVTRDSVDANSLLVSVCIYNGSAIATPAGFTQRFDDATSKLRVVDKLDSGAAGAQTVAWTGLTGNTKGASIVVAFKTAGVRSVGDIRCIRYQYRIEELFSAPAALPNGTARSPAFVAPAVDNSLILSIGAFGGGNVVEVTDDHGNVWEQLYDSGYDPLGNGSGSLWIVRRCVGTASTITITATIVIARGTYLSNEANWSLWEYANLPSDTDVLASGVRVTDNGVGGLGVNSVSITTNMTTAASAQLVLGFLAGGIDNFAGLDHGAGWTTRYSDSGSENQMIEKVTNGGATQTATWTWDTLQVASYFLVALGSRGSSSSGTITTQRRASFSAPDLPGFVGQRAETLEWEVLDSDLGVAGSVTPVGNSASIRHDVGSDIIRTVDNFELTENDCLNLNMLTTRIRPVWIMDDLSRWPLGVFLFSAADRHPRSMTGASTRSMSMYDQNVLLLDKRRQSFGLTRGSSLISAMYQLCGEVGITPSVGATGAVAGDDLAWPPATPRLTILRHLCALAGMLRPYFDNWGNCVIVSSPDLNSTEPAISYDTGPGSRINVESIVTAQDLFDVPNVYIVKSSGATESEVSAYALVPATMPHSVQNTGREKVEELNLPGVADSNAGFLAANAVATQRIQDFYTYEFSAAPDPRHDTYQIIGIDGVNYREVSWGLPCQPGAAHTHSLRLAYSLVQNPGDTAPTGVGKIMP